MSNFKEFVEKWNTELDSTESNYCPLDNGLTVYDSPMDSDFASELLYEDNDEYKVLVNRVIDIDLDSSLVDREIVFQVKDDKYFIGICEACCELFVTKIYPVSKVEQINTEQYLIEAEKKNISVRG